MQSALHQINQINHIKSVFKETALLTFYKDGTTPTASLLPTCCLFLEC